MFKSKSFVFVLTCSLLSGCAGMDHIGYLCYGHTKSEVKQKFGPPERVVQSTEGAETWEYTMGGGVRAYTFQGEDCVKDTSRTH